MTSGGYKFGRRSLLRGTLAAGAHAFLGKRKSTAQQRGQPVVQKTVYAWYPERFGTWNTESIQWDAITHICFRSVGLQGDGTIARPAGNPPQAFLDEARAHGVKVCVLAWSNNQKDSDSYLANHAQETAQSLLAYAGSKTTARTVARDVVTLMSDYYRALGDQRNKLLLGINSFPWPGYEFRCRTAERLSPTAEAGAVRPFDYLESQAAVYGKRWDSKQQSAWYVYQDGDQFVEGWYDDDHSWAAKLDYVNQEGLAGVGIWVLDGAYDSPAMWDMLRTSFAPPKTNAAGIA